MGDVKTNYGYLKDITESYNGCSYSSAISYIYELAGKGSHGIRSLSSKIITNLSNGKLSTEWAENILKNNVFISYIEGTTDGIEISRYIKDANFINLGNKFNKEFDNIVQFDKFSSDDVLNLSNLRITIITL